MTKISEFCENSKEITLQQVGSHQASVFLLPVLVCSVSTVSRIAGDVQTHFFSHKACVFSETTSQKQQ